MKPYKITYDVSIGSVWPKGVDHVPTSMSDVQFPEGGKMMNITLSFEAEDGQAMQTADQKLDEYVKDHWPGSSYHIWYWSWWNLENQ